ncbi:competence type IV pilus ATPase ComGA [Limosilactobacillus sp.]|uniref:competence type IV pilus ATPase ComGA n=1 Tax=Limosilactobacillus sp. TaxID=2773925 RepID=UPI003F0CBAFF
MEAFEKELNVIINRRIADLYVLPFKNYYRLMVAEQGQLKLFKEVPQDYACRLITYLKYRADMAVSEHRRPQLGALTWHSGPEKVNLRLSSVGDYQGRESLVVRFIYQLTDDSYHLLFPEQWQELKTLLHRRGLILFAGPMGSGKTTTMYRLARELASRQVVMTIEDPVEISEPRFVQLQINDLAGMGYQQLLRLGLRHRPNVFIIGEIRDPQTAMMTIQAALSGHLVLGTVHARDVYGVIARLIQLGISPYYLEQVMTGVCYQRLLMQSDATPAVLFDQLSGPALANEIQKQQGRGMTNAWTRYLDQAVATGQLTSEEAAKYQNG